MDGGQMNIGRDQIDRFLSFLFNNDHSHLAQILEVPNKLGHFECFGLPIQEEGDFAIGGIVSQKGLHLRSLSIDPEDRVGLELRDHMVTTPSADPYQTLCPVPTIRQNIEFTRQRELKPFDDLFSQSDLRLKRSTSLGSFGMIESCPER